MTTFNCFILSYNVFVYCNVFVNTVENLAVRLHYMNCFAVIAYYAEIYFAYLERALLILAEVRLANIELADYCHTRYITNLVTVQS